MPEMNHSIPRAILPIILCVEKSTIAEINECFVDFIEMVLSRFGKENADYICKAVVCSFDSAACLDNLRFDNISNINIRETISCISKDNDKKVCSFVKLFETLDKKMSNKELFCEKPYLVPLIFWLIDGENDYCSDDKIINTLSTNKWFKNSKHYFCSYNEVSESANEIKNKLTSPWYKFKKIGDQDLKEVCCCLFNDFELVYSVHSVCNDDYFDWELAAKDGWLLSPTESTLTRGLGFSVYNSEKNKEDAVDFIEFLEPISIELAEEELNKNSEFLEKNKFGDELVKVDPINDNDSIDDNELTGWD